MHQLRRQILDKRHPCQVEQLAMDIFHKQLDRVHTLGYWLWADTERHTDRARKNSNAEDPRNMVQLTQSELLRAGMINENIKSIQLNNEENGFDIRCLRSECQLNQSHNFLMQL